MSLVSSLLKINRWWNTGRIEQSFLYKTVRHEFDEIAQMLPGKRILSVIGPRRVGKSTLLFQTIDHLLKNGTDAKRILFFSADDPAVISGNVTIGDVLEQYASEILHENFTAPADKVYIFIDEIHTRKDWQLWLKSYYDRNLNIKFVISGSSASHLFEGSKESLLGRLENVQVLPLPFNQFCDFYNVYMDLPELASYQSLLPKISAFENLAEYFAQIKEIWWQLESTKPYVLKALKAYLLAGGYPEYFESDSVLLWQKRLVSDIVGQGLYRDIVSIYDIKNPEKLEKLLYFISANSGQDFAFKTIGETVSADTVTVSNYLAYLSQAFLIAMLENYSTNIGKTIRKNKKIHVLDNGISNAMLHINELTPDLEGHLVESNCVKDVLACAQRNFWKVHYWRENSSEVDIVIDKRAGLLPIEVKYRNDASDTVGLKAFIKAFEAPEALIVTKNTFDEKDGIYFIPYWALK